MHALLKQCMNASNKEAIEVSGDEEEEMEPPTNKRPRSIEPFGGRGGGASS